ncbi:unnamed protein product [Darwinula stevensoni]|uniref:PiggyBac transposable element-derived protein domain-containing protein n=1 Tax=Darwinula stevensoni TaxID=69355 RepID=A0A7R9A2M1_9CRUS|nr:unnamed protein product [Darwinula stevensoni]CAG0888976.1 unnamed protein product [Darwinula stevensoni]
MAPGSWKRSGGEEGDVDWIEELLSRFSPNGIPRVLEPYPLGGRLLWFFIMILFMVLCLWQSALVVQDFLTYPKVVGIQVMQDSTMEFPAVTVCSYNVLSRSAVEKEKGILSPRMVALLDSEKTLQGDDFQAEHFDPCDEYDSMHPAARSDPSALTQRDVEDLCTQLRRNPGSNATTIDGIAVRSSALNATCDGVNAANVERTLQGLDEEWKSKNSFRFRNEFPLKFERYANPCSLDSNISMMYSTTETPYFNTMEDEIPTLTLNMTFAAWKERFVGESLNDTLEGIRRRFISAYIQAAMVKPGRILTRWAAVAMQQTATTPISAWKTGWASCILKRFGVLAEQHSGVPCLLLRSSEVPSLRSQREPPVSTSASGFRVPFSCEQCRMGAELGGKFKNQMSDSDSDVEALAELSDSESWGDLSSDTDTDETSDASEESVPELSDVRTWCSIDCGVDHPAPPRFPFTGSPGLKVNVEQDNPLAYLRLFLTDEVINKIVTETNHYHDQQSATQHGKFSRTRKWEPVTKEDIWRFLGLIILQGVVGKPLQKWYWTTNRLLATPFFGTVMSEYRFSLIMKYIHFSNNEDFDEATHPAPKLKKIWEICQMIVKNFQETYVPDRDVSVDESLMAYKGRLSWIQYIASKRARFGIKSYMLCESATGYIWNAAIYTGKDQDDVLLTLSTLSD